MVPLFEERDLSFWRRESLVLPEVRTKKIRDALVRNVPVRITSDLLWRKSRAFAVCLAYHRS